MRTEAASAAARSGWTSWPPSSCVPNRRSTSRTTATLILDLVDPARTALVNDPRGLRVCSEHLLPLHFPDLIPPTAVTGSRSPPCDATT